MSDDADSPAMRQRVEDRYRQLAELRQLRPIVAVVNRFNEIDGGTLGTVVSVQLFTTVIPLAIIGFSYLTGFADNASPGVVVSRQLGLVSPLTDHVREAFGRASGLRSTWTFFGVAGFLAWGIPMSMTIAGIFAKAWRREPFGWGSRLWRGATWFVLYLTMIGLRERIAFGAAHHAAMQVLLFVASLIPVWIFWTITPALLVRGGGRGRAGLALAGLAGVVIEGTVLPLAARMVFPPLLLGWDDFGPIGVAMAVLTWCGISGIGWVVTACAGAVLWERASPSHTVIESETDGVEEPPGPARRAGVG
ncbi:hypothetical protein BOO86_06595 [Mycobacterium sp. CBMA 234]|uniref:hypothetical protein n=1 Tax=Mycolicibacterium sp. CBMA 234 TaxID=1918495 RepID=UPI0012DD1859|nr:hypothetical protein [Mycolicibacterium sp. CBMA 234]MUL64129.1 hypothetical protein [Mycolicibacterium sp. CBMA 234]